MVTLIVSSERGTLSLMTRRGLLSAQSGDYLGYRRGHVLQYARLFYWFSFFSCRCHCITIAYAEIVILTEEQAQLDVYEDGTKKEVNGINSQHGRELKVIKQR